MGIEQQAAPARHAVVRVRREPARRMLTVIDTEQLTPQMLRVRLGSPDLAGFESAAPDDHIKLFVPEPYAGGQERCARDYTPRAFDAANDILTIDFALHDAGPATRWAMAARPGDKIEIGGPKGSAIVTDDFDWYLLIGDETALPSIGRRLEELRPDVPVRVMAIVDSDADRQTFATRDGLDIRWFPRDGRSPGIGDAELVIAALGAEELPAGEGYVWVAAEARAARALRDFLIDDLGHPKAWTRASGYWSAGEAGAHTSLKD